MLEYYKQQLGPVWKACLGQHTQARVTLGFVIIKTLYNTTISPFLMMTNQVTIY